MKKSMSFAAVALMALAACVTSCTKEDIVATAISTPKDAVMFVDSTLQLTATVEPANAKVTWESEDMNIVMVDANNGLVSAKSDGECKVYAVSGTMRAATKITVLKNPVTLKLEIASLTQTKVEVAVTPSYEEGYYYCGFSEKAIADAKSDAQFIEEIVSQLTEKIKEYEAKGRTVTYGDLVKFKGTKTLNASGLQPNTEYVMLAFGIDGTYGKPSPVLTRLPFTTKAVVPSDMEITFSHDSISKAVLQDGKEHTLIYFSITPTKNDPYVWGGLTKEVYDENFKSTDEYMQYLAVKGNSGKGKISAYFMDLEDGTSVVMGAIGYEGGFTTKPFMFDYTYTAPTEGKPARLTPKFNNDAVEITADMEEEVMDYIPGMCH